MQMGKAGLALFMLAMAGTARAGPFEMDVLETDDLRLLYFDPPQTYLVPHVGRSFKNSLDFQRAIFNWAPTEKTTILLTDLSDYGNAGASASPHNAVAVYVAPASHTLETLPGSERIFNLMNHELVHVANMDASNRQDRRWRKFFAGKPRQNNTHPESILYNYLATPRLNVPRWYLEGAAVFMETWMSGGIGRAQGAYDEMVFRSMVRDGAHFYSNLGLVSEGTEIDFQTGTNAYLYGTRFMCYLAWQYSPEHVVEWLKRGEDSERYYANQFRKVFDRDLEQAWDEWIAWELDFQRENLRRVRAEALTTVQRLAPQALGSISRSYIDDTHGSLVGAFRYPGVVAHVGEMALADGRITRIADIKGPMKYRVTSTAYDAGRRTLFYTADNANYRDLMAVDLDSGKQHMLLKDARIGDIVFDRSDASLWGLRHLNGFVTLVRIPYPYGKWEQVHSFPYGEVLFELDVSADGKLLSTSVGGFDGIQFLRVYRTADLLEGNISAYREQRFGDAIPEGFVFSDDGRYLFGSAYLTGVSNIFRYEIESSALEAVSNSETGLFRPIPRPDGSLVVFEYSGAGFVPARIDPAPLEDLSAIVFLGSEIARKHPQVQKWSVISGLANTPHEEIITHQGKYRPYRELALDAAYPVVEGYRDFEALGWHFGFADPAQLHHLDVSASYSWDSALPSSEKLHVNAEYRALNWRAQYWHNAADFYDLFGPTERSRKGDAFILGYDRALIYDEPRRLDLTVDLAAYSGLDTLPGNQNVSTFLFDELLRGRAELAYSNTRKSQGAVDHEKGYRWDLAVVADRANSESAEKYRGGLDFGFALPWKHSSVWFYNSAGTAAGNPANPLSSFYFGGFGNNYVDDGEIKRYREYDSMPGFEIDAIGARDFVKSVVEWNLPPRRFRDVGSPSLFLKSARPAIFAAVLSAGNPGRSDQTYTSLGAQVDFEFTLAHRLPMTFSIGYAAAYKSGSKRDSEWMVSLKIL